MTFENKCIVKDKHGYYGAECDICGFGCYDTNKRWVERTIKHHSKEYPHYLTHREMCKCICHNEDSTECSFCGCFNHE